MTPVVVIYIRRNNLGKNRIGITTSKKIGNAVKRNRARRIIKEAYRLSEPELKQGYDYVFVARGKTPHVKMMAVQRIFQKSLLFA